MGDYDNVTELIGAMRNYGIPVGWASTSSAPVDDGRIVVGINPRFTGQDPRGEADAVTTGVLVSASYADHTHYQGQFPVSPDDLEAAVAIVVEKVRQAPLRTVEVKAAEYQRWEEIRDARDDAIRDALAHGTAAAEIAAAAGFKNVARVYQIRDNRR